MPTAPSSLPATSLKPDGYGAIVSVLASMLGAAGVAAKLGLDQAAVMAILGGLIIVVTAFRAWWEGTQYKQGGSIIDPIGAVSGALLMILGAFRVPIEFLSADAMIMVVTWGFGAGAAARAAWRKRQATIIETTATAPK